MTTCLRLLTRVLLTSSTLVLTQCRKTDEPPAPQLTEREKWLSAHAWLPISVAEERRAASGAVTTTEVDLSFFDACGLDDLIYYHADRTFSVDDGPLTCLQRQLKPGTWALAANETELVVSTDLTSRFAIRSLSATTLSYVFSHNTQPDGDQVSLIATYAAP